MEVTLKKPSRLNTAGRIFTKGVPVEVPDTIARNLYSKWRDNFDFNVGQSSVDPVAEALGLDTSKDEVSLEEAGPEREADRIEAITDALELLEEGEKVDLKELSEILGWTASDKELKKAKAKAAAKKAPKEVLNSPKKGSVTYKAKIGAKDEGAVEV